MKRIFLTAAVVVIAVSGLAHFSQRSPGNETAAEDADEAFEEPAAEPRFRCEGKQHCSEMTSCAEARFYLENCPNMKVDGDNDGVPCESQWCGGG